MKSAFVCLLSFAVPAILFAAQPTRFERTELTNVIVNGGVRLEKGPATSLDKPRWGDRSEWTEVGDKIRVGKKFIAHDDEGNVFLVDEAKKAADWKLVAVDSRGARHDDKTDWKGSWSVVTYTLRSLAPGMDRAKLGFKDDKLTLHADMPGIAILYRSRLEASEISGK